MPLSVITVAAGGQPVVWDSTDPYALPVTEATNGFGVAVTKVTSGGMPVTYVTAGGAIVSPFTPTTWNPADKSAVVTLSNGNLTATFSSATIGGVRGGIGPSTGKYYFEATMTAWNSTTGVGVSTATAALSASAVGNCHVRGGVGGSIIRDGASAGPSLGTRANGDVIGVAIDFSLKRFWCRVAPAGNWNGIAGDNPATGTGGVDISVNLTGALFPLFVSNTSAQAATANFGGSAFSGAVPSGFTAGWG